MIKRRLELKVETETIVLRGPAPSVSWCPECEKPAPRITAGQAAMISGVSDLAVYKMIKGGRLHHAETAAGRLEVCLDSLAKACRLKAAGADVASTAPEGIIPRARRSEM